MTRKEIDETCAETRERKTRERNAILDTIVPLVLAFGVGSIFCVICGASPFQLYGYILKRCFFSLGGILNTLGYATPIIMTGIATAFSIKAGIWNMGIEGQVFLGAFVSALAGYMVKGLPSFIHIPLCLLLGAFAGAMYALIPGVLKAKYRINEVVTTVMLNSIATIITGFLTQSYLGTGDAYAHTEFILESARLSKIVARYRCTTALFIALAIWTVLFFVLTKTKFGFEVSCIGKQLEFSDAVGMHVRKKIVQIFLIGGAVAGIAGATEILGVNYNFVNTFSANPGIGWDGFFACILSLSNPVGILVYAIVFGALRYGALAAQTGLGVPLDLINVIKSALVLFMAIKIFSSHGVQISAFLCKHFGKIKEETV